MDDTKRAPWEEDTAFNGLGWHPQLAETPAASPMDPMSHTAFERGIRLAYELGERVKELNCLYGLTRLIETPNISLSEILQGTVELLPPAWQYPSIASARLVLNGQVFQTTDFRETSWRQSHAILVYGTPVGTIELDYLEQPPCGHNDPFLREEEALIQALAHRLGRVIEHVQTEDVLNESTSRLHAIVEAVQDAVLVLDKKGCISFWNPAAEFIFGYSEEEALGLDFQQLLAPSSDHAGHFTDFSVLEEAGVGRPVSRTLELEAVRKNGEVFFIDLSLAAIRRTDAWRAVGIARDITQRKRSEEALQKTEWLLRETQRIARVGGWKANPGTDYLEWTKGVYDIVDASFDHQPGLADGLKYFLPQYLPALRANIAACLETGAPFTTECQLLTESQKTVWVEVSGLAPVVDDVRSYVIGTIQDISERKAIEALSKEADRRTRTILENLPAGIVVLDRTKHNFVFANRTFCGMLGYDPEDVLHLGFSDIHPPESPCDVSCQFENLLQGESHFAVNIPVLRKNGAFFSADIETSLVDLDGRPCLLAVYSDTSTRRQAEEDLLASQKRHQDILLTAMDGYWLVNKHGRLEEVNAAYCQMSGYSADELMEKHIHDLDAIMTEEDIGMRMTRITEAKRARFESRHRRKNGTFFDVEICVQHRTDQQQFVCFLRDITGRKRAERVMSARFHLLQRSTAEPLAELLRVVLDEAETLTESRGGFYYFVDEGQSTLTLQAWSTSAIQDRGTAEERGAQHDLHQTGLWADCIRRRKPIIREDYAILADRRSLPSGHVKIVRVLVVPVFRGDRIVAVMGVDSKPTAYEAHDIETVSSLADFAWDVAERKRAETEKTVIQTQLHQAQRMESIGQLAGGVAHDFNNLLQVILVNAELTQENLDHRSACRQHLDEVQKAAGRAAELTRQLLAFGRRQVIRPINLDLNDVIHGVSKMLRRLIGEHIQLQTVAADALGTVWADKGQVEQVIMNLCLNARDAMPRGGKLAIQTDNVVLDEEFCYRHPWAKPGSYVLLNVTDTGEGMDEDTRAHIFEPFFTTKEQGKGTGLGLASVHGIVSQHAGLIHVYSELGVGTVFKVYFPAVEGTVAAHVPDAKTHATGGAETLLVAEDDPTILTMLENLLDISGYTVLTAADGEEALQVFRENAASIDLIVIDVMMPKLGGKAVMNRLRSEGYQVPFLFSSGYSEDMLHRDFAVPDGFNLIQKPHSRQALLSEVRRVLDMTKGGQ